MGAETAIAWTDSTFNPWWGCSHAGPGCDNCYAEAFDKRVGGTHWGPHAPRRTFGEKHWNEPRRWNARAAASGHRHLVFCASMADVFDNKGPADQRDRLWALIRDTPALTWQLVTKRIGNAADMLPNDWGNGYPNVWILATIVNQVEADRDIPKLRRVPARIRGLSMEPLLGQVDLTDHLNALDWVIAGGESGPYARLVDERLFDDLRRQCDAAGVAFFYKQRGGRALDKGGCLIGGREHKAWPLAA